MSTSQSPPPITAYTDGAIRAAIATHEIAGGAGQPTARRVTRSDANVIADTKAKLRSGIATAGNTVFIPRNVSHNLTGDAPYTFARNVTLASDRGANGSAGALLYTSAKGKDSTPWRGVFRVPTSAPGVRITGLRFRGPQYATNRTDGRPAGYLDTNRNQDAYYARGIHLQGNGGTVDNCELMGWTGDAVAVGARYITPSNCLITRNHIHDCMMIGYGYGVDVFNGHPVISKNYFDSCRHAVDGFGYHTNGYDCQDNIFGPRTYSHHVDMHCLGENKSGGSINPSATNYDLRAGGLMRIRRNTFVNIRNINNRYSQAIVIRGYPAERCEIENNRFHNLISGAEPVANVRNSGGQNVPYRQPNTSAGWHRMHFRNNQYGPAEPYHSGTGAPIDLGHAILTSTDPSTGGGGPPTVTTPPTHIPLWTDPQRRGSVARGLDECAERVGELSLSMREH